MRGVDFRRQRRMLVFTASDGGQSKEGRKALERVVGDPMHERDEMMAGSPIYHYRDLQVPLDAGPWQRGRARGL